jgi:uncharacterized protein YccT (UPF0319 family)
MMKVTSLLIICLVATSAYAVDISDIEDLELLAMDTEDAFSDVLALFDQLIS